MQGNALPPHARSAVVRENSAKRLAPGFRAHLQRDRWWVLALVAGAVFCGVYALVPAQFARSVLHPLIAVWAFSAIGLGMRLHRPDPAGPWRLIMASAGMLVVGSVLAIPAVDVQQAVPGSSAHDLVEAAAFVCLLAAGWWMLRRQTPYRDPDSLLDAAIVAVAVTTVLWALIPLGGTALRFDLALSHVAIGVMLGAICRMLIIGAPRPVAAGLLLLAAGAVTGGDIAWALWGAGGFEGGLADQIWAAAYPVAAAAALHPSMRDLVVARSGGQLGAAHLLVVGLALLAVPVVALSTAGSGFRDAILPAAGAVALVVLVLVHLGRLHTRRETQAQHAASLASLGQHVVAAGSADAMRAIAEREISRTVPGATLREAPPADGQAWAERLTGETARVPVHASDTHTDLVVTHEGPYRLSGEDRSYLRTAALLVASGMRRHAAEAALRYRAEHDMLTGLPNRSTLADELASRFADAAAPHSTAVVMIDLDGFKRINDTFGHHAGDQALRVVSERLANVLREGDVLARFAGDEFVVIADDVDAETANALARRLVNAVDQPLRLEHGEVRLRASAGIVLGGAGDDPEELLCATDNAMYRAKSAGGQQVCMARR